MLFLDHRPDAPNNRIELAPKLPTGWATMSYNNIKVGPRAIDVTCSESATLNSQTFRNVTGGALDYDTYIRLPAVAAIRSVKQNGVPVAYTYDAAVSRVHVTGALDAGAGSQTVVAVQYNDVRGDFDHDGDVDPDDLTTFENCATGPNVGPPAPGCAEADADLDNDVDQTDFGLFQRCLSGSGVPADPGCEG
jgi:hypothetical protein